MLKLPKDESKTIAKWLVSAFLPEETAPALIITGKARHEVTKKLRQLLDPVANAMLEIPPAGKIDAINKIRTGTEVVLKDASKLRPPIRQSMQRPVIISAHVAPKIHEG